MFADRPDHSHGVVDLEVAALVGSKIMIWYTLGTQDVRKRSTLPTVEGTESPMGRPEGAAASTDAGRAQAMFGPVTTAGG
jgi:hypothetical protein